jgi:DNA-binding transcriptional LysR family regulator
MNIQIRHVRSFITVAHEKNFARAAKRLNVSQPALSQTIIQFEESLGFPLFERTTRSVCLTPAGELVRVKALAFNQAVERFYDDLRSLQSALRNELHVGFMIGTAVQFIPAIVREFEKARPDASLCLKEFDFSDPSAGLRDGIVDCGIIRPPVGLDDIDIVEIAHEKCVACFPIGHRLGEKRSVIVADILDEPIIASSTPGIWRDYWLATEYRKGAPAKVAFEASTVESELQAVASGKGISITAESTAKYYSRPGVVFKTIADMPDCVMAIGYRRTPNTLVADFVAAVKRVSAQMARPPSRTPRINV